MSRLSRWLKAYDYLPADTIAIGLLDYQGPSLPDNNAYLRTATCVKD